jgi:hypothetical protein
VFNASISQWIYLSGNKTKSASGIYGTKGVASASNCPGARQRSVTWRDSKNNLYLFSGLGYDSKGDQGICNLGDLLNF